MHLLKINTREINPATLKGIKVIKVITTKYGQLVAKVDKASGSTTILDGSDMEPIAKVQSVSKEGVMKAIGQIASFLRKRQALIEMGVQLETGANRLESIDTESFEETVEEPQALVTEPASALEQPVEQAPEPFVPQETPKRSPGRPKGKRRGRKPGQKVKRNPELSWS